MSRAPDTRRTAQITARRVRMLNLIVSDASQISPNYVSGCRDRFVGIPRGFPNLDSLAPRCGSSKLLCSQILGNLGSWYREIASRPAPLRSELKNISQTAFLKARHLRQSG